MYTITKSPQKENPPIKQEQIKASAIIMREATVTIVVCCLCPFCSHSLYHALQCWEELSYLDSILLSKEQNF